MEDFLQPLIPPTLQVKAYMQASDVVVAPFTEPHAAKGALEAQFLGKPVILYDSEEAQEYVRQEKSGLIVPCGDVRRLARELDGLVVFPEKAISIGREGARFVKENFSRKKSMTIITSFLKERVASSVHKKVL